MAHGIKTGGRDKGTLNKTTLELREKFTLLIESNFDKLQKDIDLLEPKDRIKTILELAKFVVPTLKAIDFTDNSLVDSSQVTISFTERNEIVKIINELKEKY
jgi:hypothetical protein